MERHRVGAVVIGAGAAGLHCAGLAARRGVEVLLIDHATAVAEKIRISGGGRCNFTNLDVGPQHFLSANPHFSRSALARYTPRDFIALVDRHGIAWHEKHKGQLFCDDRSDDIVRMLLAEAERGAVERWQPCTVQAVEATGDGFELATDRGRVTTRQLVVATGGLSIPKIGATDFGHRLARQFGHRIEPTRPALVPLTFDPATWAPFSALSGLALEVRIATGTGSARSEFLEDLLFTHRGLSGPAVLQISTHWHPGSPLTIDLAPGRDLRAELEAAKSGSKRKLGNALAEAIPRRLAETWLAGTPALAEKTLPEVRNADLTALAARLEQWTLLPQGTEGYRKAEVTAGGVDTREVSSRTLESRRVPGLYFIGEVLDVTGWLGGYNFQWAWASAAACAEALLPQ